VVVACVDIGAGFYIEGRSGVRGQAAPSIFWVGPLESHLILISLATDQCGAFATVWPTLMDDERDRRGLSVGAGIQA
jgi:hypothetical protein